LWAILAGIAIGGYAPSADAAVRLRVEDTTTPHGVVLTGVVGGGFGMLQYSGTIDGFTVVVSTAVTFHNGPDAYAELDLSGNASSPGGTTDTLVITAEDTDYVRGAPGPLEVIADVGGTDKRGTLTLQSWADGTNAVPALGANAGTSTTPVDLSGNPIGGIPGSSTPAFTPPGFVVVAGGSQVGFSGEGAKPFTAGPLYSLFAQVTFQSNGVSQMSFDDDQTVVPVPAGMILALSGAPFLGVGAWLRRRKQKQAA